MWPGLFFNLGYALLWIGLLAAARNSPLRSVVVFLFPVTTILVGIVTTYAHRYFQEIPLLAWMLLFAALLFAAFGPWPLIRTIGRRRGRLEGGSQTEASEVSFFGPLGILLVALSLGSLSLLVGSAPDTKHPQVHTRLAQASWTQKRNVVLIHLESTRAQSVTPYNQDLKTTPFLDELAKSSLLAEQAHVVLPRSSKGSVAVNCGIEPPLYPGPEFVPGDIPVPCLAGLLNEQGYNTAFFQSATSSGFGDLVKNFGYAEFYPPSSMDTEGFAVTNTFGYEEDMMLKPSEQWLKNHMDEPFMAEYFMGTGHYGYECLGTRYGDKDFAEDDQLNRYLNCLRLQDIFLKNLFDQYKELGLYENTIFVLFGDHGEGFKEHGRDMHGDTIWEEGLRIPLIIHAPGWFENGERVEGLSSQIDILPTVMDLLGYEVKDGQYPGYSLLQEEPPQDRILRFSCISERKCLASIKGTEKYIYHYGNQSDEFFDLSKDPFEKQNLVSERSKEEIDERREDLIVWSRRVNAQYGPILINGSPYSQE
jgi:lipoteichoic acid synthase